MQQDLEIHEAKKKDKKESAPRRKKSLRRVTLFQSQVFQKVLLEIDYNPFSFKCDKHNPSI